MAAPDIVTKRIHVGGLTPSITPAHIKDRFKSFGNVLDVEDLKADALGKRIDENRKSELRSQASLDHSHSLPYRLRHRNLSSVSQIIIPHQMKLTDRLEHHVRIDVERVST